MNTEDTEPEMVPSISTEAADGTGKEKKQRKKREKSAVSVTLRIIRRNFWSFCGFELLYKLLTFGLITPLIRRITSLILYFNGINSLTNDNFFGLLKHPATWIGLVLVIYLVGMMISVEFAGLIGGIHASQEGKKISVHEMFMNGIAGCGSVLHIKNWMYLVYVIIVMPLASIAETATLTGSFTLPGFILEAINEKWYLQTIYMAGMLAVIYLAFRWIYIIPSMNLNHNSFKEASAESSRLMRKRLWKSIWALAVCYLFLFILMAVLALAIGSASFAVIHWLDPGLDLTGCIEPVVITDAIIVYITFTAISSPLVLCRIYVGYQRLLRQEGREISAYAKPDTWFTSSRIFKLTLTACLALGVYFFLPGRYQEVKLMVNNASNKAMVMAHRGDSVDAPENTLPAFQAAMDHGADAAEMDVQMTKDGTIVVLHDSSIDRTSTGHGKIWDVTYDEIKDLDNGSFFSPEFADTHIPTLDQVIKLCKDKLYLNIEIKRTGHDDGIEQKVVDIIKNNGFQNQCDITSMDYQTLVTVRSIDPTIKTVYTTTVALGNVADLSAADAFSVESTFVNQSFVHMMFQSGKQIFVWTVNDEDQMHTMVNLGANAIITNDPSTCRAIVDENSEQGIVGILNRLRTGLLGS